MSDVLKQAGELSHELDIVSSREFGAPIQAPAIELGCANGLNGLITSKHEAVKGADIVPIGANFSRLTRMAGSVFGLLTNESGATRLYPGIITSRTTPDKIHFTYLEDAINPANIRALTPLQRIMLEGGLGMQDGKVGTKDSHDTVSSTATEIGHTAMAMRSLTDPKTMRAIQSGSHIAHDWGGSSAGIAPNLTSRSAAGPGAFDLQTAAGARDMTFKTIEITDRSPVALVRASAFEAQDELDLSFDRSKLVIGVGILAAQQLHGNNTNEQLKSAMSQI